MAEISDKSQLISHLSATTDFKVSLDAVKEVANLLHITPQYPIILVAGTNGKGSTCAYLTTILSNAGYRTGSFTSPHVFDYNERIAINNISVNDEELSSALQAVITADKRLNLGIFKTFSLAAHLLFTKHSIEIAVVEVGIGGRYDVTNLFEPCIAAITTIGLDHCDILGNTVETIGLNKAGIFRPHKPAIVGGKTVPQTVIDYAQQIQADLSIINQDFGYRKHQLSWDFFCQETKYYSLPLPGLRGFEQLNNAAIALAILTKLRQSFPLSLSHIKNGLLESRLSGRFQVLPGVPQIIMDVAHNPQAIEMMLQNMLQLPMAKRNFAIFGIAADKDWQQVLRLTIGAFERWFIAPLDSKRSCEPLQIRDFLLNNGKDLQSITICDSVETAFSNARNELNDNDRLVCFGSFLIVEGALRQIRKVKYNNAT